MKAKEAKQLLHQHRDKEKAKILQGFFKTGPGQYGEGDIFIGVPVPLTRSVARQCEGFSLPETQKLLHSPIHEERLLAILILIEHFQKADPEAREKIFRFYINNTKFINNWDLVDLSAPHIVGVFLNGRDKDLLLRLAHSSSLWERRIAIVATFNFIRSRQFSDTLKIAEILLQDKEDLIHKAGGWMLREVGKRDLYTEKAFLNQHYKTMPRTMLRYAIERFPVSLRQAYLKGTA